MIVARVVPCPTLLVSADPTAMMITAVEAIPVSIPFTHTGPPTGFGGRVWTTADYLVVRVSTDAGLSGYGEAFGYNVVPATRTFFETLLAPLVVGRECADPVPFMEELKQTLHLFGRGGVAHYALSGLDIALWDLAGKAAGLPVWKLKRARARSKVPAYASLLRLGAPATVERVCAEALARGYRRIKLHERARDAVAAARAAVGGEVDLMLDVNAAWARHEAIDAVRALRPCGLKWIEEPLWPPEDIAGLAEVHEQTGVPVAAGENAPNAFAFRELVACEGVEYIQPSITKLGGVSEFLHVGDLAEGFGKTLAPHSPYYGPGLLATLQMAALYDSVEAVEALFIDLEAPLFADLDLPGRDGHFVIPEAPGLGADPDPAVLERYRRD